MPDLNLPVTAVPGIGPAVAAKLSHLNISSVFDLLYHLPFRYEDRTRRSSLSQLQPGESFTAEVTLVSIKNEFTRRGRIIQKAVVSDSTGQLPVIWFNQSYLVKTLRPGFTISLFGKAEISSGQTSLVSPDYEIVHPGQPLLHTGRLVPVYPETAGITSKWLRSKIYSLLSDLTLPDFLPPEIFRLTGIPEISWRDALWTAHFPDHLDQVPDAKSRLAFDELFLLQLLAQIHRREWARTRLSHRLSVSRPLIDEFTARLPFSLTSSQNLAIAEILSDLSGTRPMNRLLEGDVGSGKTIVAAVAAYTAALNGFSTLFLAPTQILALQHYQTLSQLFSVLDIPVHLITASARQMPSDHSAPAITVGTHALLDRDWESARVGLVIIDEQHRFGVAQRAAAAAKGHSPHILTMTATPIPRTIALTLHGDLDLSLLTELPSGRQPVKTWVVPETKRQPAYDWIKSRITAEQTQCFIVCPFIEESESLSTVRAATTEYSRLQSVFAPLNLGLLHGRLKPKDKDRIIDRFRSGDYHILVSTPVVEVGIDIPAATIMVIEGAERFGLAQLHQLRGRVGRSGRQSFCLLFADSSTSRLKALETHHSGLELAEIDLKLRGPGDIYGTAQHGLPQFKVASYSDFGLIDAAKTAAQTALPLISRYPVLRGLLDPGKIALVQPN